MTIKIDLMRLLKYLLARIWLPIICAVICAGVMFYHSSFMVPDTYTASATLYVYNANPNVVNYQYVNLSDLNTAVQLIDTYMAVIRSNKVLDAVLERLDNPRLTTAAISASLSMGSVSGTGLLRISSTTPDPQLSMDICNAVASIAPHEIIRVVGAGSLEVVDYAELPKGPNSHNTMRNAMLGGMAGGVLACGLLVLMFLLNQKLTESKELTDMYTPPLLGVIPLQPEMKRRADYLLGNNSPTQLLVAYGKLRMNLTFAMKDKPKMLLVSSSVPGEGKSTVAANVAVSFAKDGKRVLLIDGDMRKPSQELLFDVNTHGSGLSEMLIGEASKDEAVLHEVRPNLDLIRSGTIPPNPAELLNSVEMRDFLHKQSDMYDLIVLDVPPINVVSDPLVLSDLGLNLLFVTRGGYSDHREIRKALKAVEFTDIPLLGMVMTGADLRRETGMSHKSYDRYYRVYDKSAKRTREAKK